LARLTLGLTSLDQRGGNMKLKPKDKAPDFELPEQNGKKVSLSEFYGRKVLLFFYPKAGTSG
jgi:peroxiredoxin Q/BCP